MTYCAILHASRDPYDAPAGDVDDFLQPKVTYIGNSNLLPNPPEGSDEYGDKNFWAIRGGFSDYFPMDTLRCWPGTHHGGNNDDIGNSDFSRSPSGSKGGTNDQRRWMSFGPYTFPPGKKLRIVYASGTAGLDMVTARRVGEQWLAGTLENPPDLPDPDKGWLPARRKTRPGRLTPGTVVDPALAPRSGPPVFAVAANYARHAVVGALQYNTLFPHARQIGADDGAGWRVTPLIDVAPRGWVDTGKLDAKPAFDSARDFPGPVNVASAFERTVGDREQRVIAVGTGHFLSNSFLGNGGNLALGISMLNWLAGDDALVAIDPRPAADAQLDIDSMRLYLIAFAVLLLLPIAFALEPELEAGNVTRDDNPAPRPPRRDLYPAGRDQHARGPKRRRPEPH